MRYVPIRGMRTPANRMDEAARRTDGSLSVYDLRVPLHGLIKLALISIIVLLILGRGAGTG